ncbi:MAG: hypothetical protein ACO3UM_11085, partial [Planctomycetota bacterium]
MRSPLLTALALCAAATTLPAQDAPPPNGPRAVDPGWHALVGARVIVAPGKVVDRATVVVRDGRIVSVEPGGLAPEGARIHDCAGLTVHAAFVDAHVPVEAPRPDPSAPGSSWHPDVVPQRSALDGIGLSNERARELRGLGFAVAAVHPQDGIIRGRSGIVPREAVAADARRRLAFRIARDAFLTSRDSSRGTRARAHPASIGYARVGTRREGLGRASRRG